MTVDKDKNKEEHVVGRKMNLLDQNKCFICQTAKPDFVVSVQQRWGAWEDYFCHKPCFIEFSGQEPKVKYSHEEWLNLAGEEWLPEEGWACVDEYSDKFWHFQDKQHRKDGPAVERANGTREWWVEGKRVEK